jgi:hypothetical protein
MGSAVDVRLTHLRPVGGEDFATDHLSAGSPGIASKKVAEDRDEAKEVT